MGASSCEADLSFIIIRKCCQIIRTAFIESCENGFVGRGERRNGKKLMMHQSPGLHNGNYTSALGELCNPSPDPIMTNY
jgi:hypothetical protein